MYIESLDIPNAKLIQAEPAVDERGSFVRLSCSREFAESGIREALVQTNLSVTHAAGTLRGMHCQRPPSKEGKLVRCLKGSVFDVMIDIRPDSPTYLRYYGAELTETNATALFIPSGCAHGFLTLTDNCHILYQMTDYYQPDLAQGFRWDDPSFAIDWPQTPVALNDRDRSYPDCRAELTNAFTGLL